MKTQTVMSAFVLATDGLFYRDHEIVGEDWTLSFQGDYPPCLLIRTEGRAVSTCAATRIAYTLLDWVGVQATILEGPFWAMWTITDGGPVGHTGCFHLEIQAPIPAALFRDGGPGYRQPFGDRIVYSFGELWG